MTNNAPERGDQQEAIVDSAELTKQDPKAEKNDQILLVKKNDVKKRTVEFEDSLKEKKENPEKISFLAVSEELENLKEGLKKYQGFVTELQNMTKEDLEKEGITAEAHQRAIEHWQAYVIGYTELIAEERARLEAELKKKAIKLDQS